MGKVVSGLLLGIMLARPVASLVAAHASWHVVFGGAAVLMLALAAVLRRALPLRQPVSNRRGDVELRVKHALEQFSDEPLRAAVEGIILS